MNNAKNLLAALNTVRAFRTHSPATRIDGLFLVEATTYCGIICDGFGATEASAIIDALRVVQNELDCAAAGDR